MSFNSISFKNVLVDIEDHLMILTINRPAKMNALDPLTHREMAEAMDDFATLTMTCGSRLLPARVKQRSAQVVISRQCKAISTTAKSRNTPCLTVATAG